MKHESTRNGICLIAAKAVNDLGSWICRIAILPPAQGAALTGRKNNWKSAKKDLLFLGTPCIMTVS